MSQRLHHCLPDVVPYYESETTSSSADVALFYESEATHHRQHRPSLQVESLPAGAGLRELLLTNRLFNQSIYLFILHSFFQLNILY